MDPHTVQTDILFLEEVWATDSVFRTPESVLYHPESQTLFVSNVNENSWEKDGNGYISRMDLKGNLLTEKWATGLSGPKGMSILDNSLFVTDIFEVVEFDLATGEQIRRFPVEHKENPQLNDLTAGDDGTLYISASGAETIYQLKDGEISVKISAPDLGRPNGVLWQDHQLYMVGSRSGTLSLVKDSLQEIATGLGTGDGLVSLGKRGFLATSWAGEIFHIDEQGQTTSLLRTEEQGIQTADIEFIPEKNWLLVPTFFDNRVICYHVNGLE